MAADPEKVFAELIRSNDSLRAEVAGLRTEIARLVTELAAMKANGAPSSSTDPVHKVGEVLGPHAARLAWDWLKGKGEQAP